MSNMSFSGNENFIDQLSDDVLLEIFNYYDGKSLKNLTLVCKRWSDVIGNSASTMKLLPLNFIRFARHPGKLMRNYHSTRIDRLDESLDLSGFLNISANIQRLTLCHSTLKNPQTLATIFGNLDMLKELILVRVQIDFDDESEHPATQLNLKKLELIQTDHKVLKFLNHIQVSNLEIIDATNKTDSESLGNFLSHQKKLESLTIENLSDGPSAMFSSDLSAKICFKLKTLSTLFSHIREVEHFEANFIPFLKQHERTMVKLKVEGSLSKEIFKFIVSAYNNLEELEINTNELPQELSFYDFLKPNCSLKVLKLNGTINRSNLNGFKGMLGHYSSIEKISLADTDGYVANDTFHLMAVKSPKLSTLSVLNLNETFAPDTVFPSLKNFSIRILNQIDQWKTFITNNPTIVSLNVGWIKRDQFTPKIIEEIINLPNLRHLKFGGRFIASKRIYDVIKHDYKHLRTLELMVANYEEIKLLKFVFPLDKTLWMPQCVYFDEGSDREPVNDW